MYMYNYYTMLKITCWSISLEGVKTMVLCIKYQMDLYGLMPWMRLITK